MIYCKIRVETRSVKFFPLRISQLFLILMLIKVIFKSIILSPSLLYLLQQPQLNLPSLFTLSSCRNITLLFVSVTYNRKCPFCNKLIQMYFIVLRNPMNSLLSQIARVYEDILKIQSLGWVYYFLLVSKFNFFIKFLTYASVLSYCLRLIFLL